MMSIRGCYNSTVVFFSDLCNEHFEAGRDETNDLVLTKVELPEKILCRISKVHFRIIKDLSDVTNPVYIEVCAIDHIYI